MSPVPIRVVVDTNFLTVPSQFGLDVFVETERLLERSVEFLVLESVKREVDHKIARSGPGEARHFRVAKHLMRERCTIVPVPADLVRWPVDDQLIEFAHRNGAVLATNDRHLRKRAREIGVPVLLLRGRRRLWLEGDMP